MSVPVISTITSVNAISSGVPYAFQPGLSSGIAYKWTASGLPPGLSIQSSYAFTVSTGDSTFNAPGNNFIVGTRVNVITAGTLPTGLTAATDFWVIAGNQLSATKGGSAVTFSSTGSGTLYIFCPDTLGRISGTPQDLGTDDVYNVTLNAYDISAGASANMVFPIGVFTPGTVADASIAMNFDKPTGVVSNPASGANDAFDIFLGSKDNPIFSIAYKDGANQLDVGQPASLVFLVKHAATGDLMLSGGGPCNKIGSGASTVYQIEMDVTSVPAPPSADVVTELSGNSDDADDDAGVYIDAIGQLQITTVVNAPDGSGPMASTRSSQPFKVRVWQDF